MTYEELEKAMMELFGPHFTLAYEELRQRILPGYAYTVDLGSKESKESRSIKLQTGRGGVLLIIDECEKKGVLPYILAEGIIVHTEKGSFPISQVKISNDGTY